MAGEAACPLSCVEITILPFCRIFDSQLVWWEDSATSLFWALHCSVGKVTKTIKWVRDSMVDAAMDVFRLAMQENWVKAIEICVIVVPRRLNP
jgi:hypothetical protein